MEKEEQIKDIVHIIMSEQSLGLPHRDTGGGTFIVEGCLPVEIVRPIAEQIYHQGYRKGVRNE